MITRENYEAYALDYLEGTLCEELKQQFQYFLEQNPDLQDEVFSMSESLPVLTKKMDKTLENKSALHKKSPIHSENEDEYLIDLLEGNTSPEQEAFVRLYIQEHPHAEKKQKRYAHTILKPDGSIVFPEKDRLKKSLLWFYTKQFGPLAVAASVLLIWAYAILFNTDIKIDDQAIIKEPSTKVEIIRGTAKDSASTWLAEKQNTALVRSKKKIKKMTLKPINSIQELNAQVILEDVDRLPQQATASIEIDSTNLLVFSKPMMPKFRHKTYVVEEKNVHGLAFVSQLITKKTKSLLAENNRRKNTEEKQSNVWAWIEKETGIRVFQTQEVSNHQVEIAMGNRIEIQSK